MLMKKYKLNIASTIMSLVIFMSRSAFGPERGTIYAALRLKFVLFIKGAEQ